MICPRCRENNPDGAVFCDNCGSFLNENSVPADIAEELFLEDLELPEVPPPEDLLPLKMELPAEADGADIGRRRTQPLTEPTRSSRPRKRKTTKAPAPAPEVDSSEQPDLSEEPPYLHVVQLNDCWHVYFVIRLVAVTRNDSGRGRNLNEQEMLYQQFSFLSAITPDSSDIEKVVELRYVVYPDRELPQRGKLDVGYICKIVHTDREIAIQLAESLLTDIYAMLPLADTQTYQFVAAYTEQEFMALFQPPFPTKGIGEIVKREELVSIGKERELYIAYPFTDKPEASMRYVEYSMHRILWKLLRERNKHILSICLMPTTLTPWERQMLRENIDTCDSVQTETEFEEASGDGRLKGTWRSSARARTYALGKIFQGYLHELSNKAWLLKIQIASDQAINQGVFDIIGAEVAGFPQYDLEKGVFKSGGYDIGLPTTAEEFQTAEHNFRYLTYMPWLYSMAPDQLTRLRSLVSLEEAFRAFRLPLPGEEGVPGVELQMVKYSPVPTNMPKVGTLLGESLYIGLRYPPRIMIKDEDRQRHMYIVGKTGVGKSTLILQMAMADIRRGLGICVVDPHGELVQDILDRLPEERVDDVIVFDPSDTERPLGLNMLEAQTEQEKHLIVNEMIGLMYKLYDPNKTGIVGPRFEHAIRNAMLTVMAEPGNTLIDVVGVLTSNQFLSAKLKKVKDPLVRSYWEDQIAHTSDFHRSEVLDYIVSKFGRFVTNDLVRNIIGQSKSAFDFREVIDEKRILLVDLSKGKIGPENSTFLGSILVPKLLIAALSRVDTKREERHNFQLYVDEFQNFASETFATMLSEARKYGLAITMAHQYLDQLPITMRSSVFGNVGSIISFRVGIDDGKHLAPEFYPVFGPDDLTNLPKFTACVKLLVDGLAVRPFSMRTLFDPAAGVNHDRGVRARQNSSENYGIPRAEIAAQIEERGSNWFRRY